MHHLDWIDWIIVFALVGVAMLYIILRKKLFRSPTQKIQPPNETQLYRDYLMYLETKPNEWTPYFFTVMSTEKPDLGSQAIKSMQPPITCSGEDLPNKLQEINRQIIDWYQNDDKPNTAVWTKPITE